MDAFMQAAIEEAKAGLAEGGIPIGSVLVHDGERGKGEWSFDKGQVCLAYPGEEEDCFDVAVEGDTVIFTDDEGGSLRLRILKGNARRL